MTADRIYPDEPAGDFDRPPLRFADRADRPVVVRRLEGEADREALVEMYVAFDPEDRAQGIPPTGEARIREWLGHILTEDCINVVAEHEDTPGTDLVGHATLVPDSEGACELAIFVLNDFQNAGIGTTLIRGLLGAGQADGVDRVWLTVERWNNAAIALYRKVGFETSGTESFELEMSLRLA
ncbi:GNAT family N-acetyltransferase [Halomarina litorea]|uniref:GNAT family N-acetyltransferase n=1 Tax=Halomarina litorea TaxID=2961595 RepID=UPI0020C3B61A|nr:GNAT family N-acetyltransferase [Halomarina sp. BCD28]